MFEENSAWDCDPYSEVIAEPYDQDIEYEDAESDWQVIALDRFSDRFINGDY